MNLYVKWVHTLYKTRNKNFALELDHRPQYMHYHSTTMSSYSPCFFIIYILCVTYLSHEWENDVTKWINWIQIGAITNPFWICVVMTNLPFFCQQAWPYHNTTTVLHSVIYNFPYRSSCYNAPTPSPQAPTNPSVS